MFRRFRHGRKHKLSKEQDPALQKVKEEQEEAPKDTLEQEKARQTSSQEEAQRKAREEEHARKRAAEEAHIRNEISKLQEKIAKLDASVEELTASYNEYLEQAVEAKRDCKPSESNELMLKARRHQEQRKETLEMRLSYSNQVASFMTILRNQKHSEQLNRFVTVMKNTDDSFFAGESDESIDSISAPSGALRQLLSDTERRVQDGIEEFKILLKKKADLLHGATANFKVLGSDRLVKDTGTLTAIRNLKKEINHADMSILNLVMQRDALEGRLDQGEAYKYLRRFVDCANSSISMFKGAVNTFNDAPRGNDTTSSDMKALSSNADLPELQTRLRNILVAMQHQLNSHTDQQGKLDARHRALLAQARRYKQQNESELLRLTLRQSNSARMRSESLEWQGSFLTRQHALADVICVLLDVLRSRNDFRLMLLMTCSPCSGAKGTDALNWVADTHEEERMANAAADNLQKMTKLCQVKADLEIKRGVLLTEAAALRKQNLTAKRATRKLNMVLLSDKENHLRTEQFVRLLSERCCLEEQMEERRLAWIFHELRTETSKLSVNDAPASGDGAAKYLEGIETVSTTVNRVFELEIERMTRTKQDLEETKDQMQQRMLRRSSFDGLVSAAQHAILSKKISWHHSTIRSFEDHVEDFAQWALQLWAHVVTKEFHEWTTKIEAEFRYSGEDITQMAEKRESELQSKLSAKMDSIRKFQMNLRKELEGTRHCKTDHSSLVFLWAEKRKRCMVKLSILAAQHSMLSSMLMKRKGPIQVLFRGHVHQSPVVKPEDFVAALEESSSMTFHDVLFANKLMSFLAHKRALFPPPLDKADARRMFLMRKLYGNLVDLTLTEGQSILIVDMLHIAKRNGILSEDNVTALLLTLRLKGNIEKRFVQLADVIDDIYKDFAGRLSVVETQLASVETALYRMKISQDRGKRVAMWASLVKFGLSMIPIAGQVAAAGLEAAVQSTEVISEMFFSESSVELASAFQDFISSAGQFAVDEYVIKNGDKLPDSVKDNIAAAKLGRMCMTVEFRDRLPPAYRERLVSAAESSWGASIDEVECDFDKIVESFREETDAGAFEIDLDDLYGADVFIEVLKIEETNLSSSNGDIAIEDMSSERREDNFRGYKLGEDSSEEDSLIQRIESQLLEATDELQQLERSLQPMDGSEEAGEWQANAEGFPVRHMSEVEVRAFEEELLEMETLQLEGASEMEIGDWQAHPSSSQGVNKKMDITIEKLAPEGQNSSLLSQETSCNQEAGADSLNMAEVTVLVSKQKDAFKRALQESETVESGKLFHDDAVKCACTMLSHDVDWLPIGYVEDAFLSTDTDSLFRVDEQQFLYAMNGIVGEIEMERRVAMSTHWAQRFLRVAPPKTGVINTTLAKHLLWDLGVGAEGLCEELDAVVRKFAVDRKVNLARFAQIWRSLSCSTTLGSET